MFDLEILNSEEYGRIARSRKDFKRGEIVLSETPILTSCSPESVTFEELQEIEKFHLSNPHLDTDEDFRFLKAFCLADPRTQAAVLDCYLPPPDAASASLVLREIVKTVGLAKRFPWAATLDADTLTKVVLIKATNAHEFNQSRAVVLFSLGSKIRHCCLPNLIYTSLREPGRGSFVAISEIKAGDELFISYISSPVTTQMRQDTLRMMYLFHCDCRGCTTGLDPFRGLRCDCERGTSFFEQALKTWKCELCGNQNPPKSLAAEKSELERLTRMQKISDPKILELEISRSQKMIGVNHAVPRLIQQRLLEILTRSREEISRIERLAFSLIRWSAEAVPTPIVVGCILGRAGRFEAAAELLNLAKKNYEMVFPADAEERVFVEKAISAVEKRQAEKVPDLCTS